MSRFRYRRLGPFSAWVGAHDGEHPSRWAGVYLPLIGEIELHVTSARVHAEPKPLDFDIHVSVDPIKAAGLVSFKGPFAA